MITYEGQDRGVETSNVNSLDTKEDDHALFEKERTIFEDMKKIFEQQRSTLEAERSALEKEAIALEERKQLVSVREATVAVAGAAIRQFATIFTDFGQAHTQTTAKKEPPHSFMKERTEDSGRSENISPSSKRGSPSGNGAFEKIGVRSYIGYRNLVVNPARLRISLK